MQTNLADFIKETPQGLEADEILRACVHCGFCLATCPTYNILGDELDGPRGRIYQIKGILEGQSATPSTQLHLDRCLTCRSCETTCPSGVRYGRLLDIGRSVVSRQLERSTRQKLLRWTLRKLLITPGLFPPLVAIGRFVRPLLPVMLRDKLPVGERPANIPRNHHQRKMILLNGCVQPSYKPAINAAVCRILHRLGIEAVKVKEERCCGAVSFHLDAVDEAKVLMRKNIDVWWPHIEAGAEAIVSSASGCGVMIKDYPHALENEPLYAEKAIRVAALTKDICEVLDQENLSDLKIPETTRVAFQSPCTLQHGQKLAGRVEKILLRLGFELSPVADGHFCCGSAGTYSILQKQLSQQLGQKKLQNLERGNPQVIATANIGCLMHLESGSRLPVKHWVELLDDVTLSV